MNIKSTVERITPEIATKILEEAKETIQNRNVSEAHVEWLASQMKAGKWTLNGEPIILDEDGRLLDGQHRLWAVVNCDVAIESLVTRGVDRRNFATIDSGRARTLGNVLAIAGERTTNVMAAVLGWVYLHEQGRMLWRARSAGYTASAALALSRKHLGVREAIDWAMTAKRVPVFSKVATSPLAFMRYNFVGHNAVKAGEFFDLVADALPDQPGSPTRLLRDWYFRHQHLSGRTSPLELMAVTVKAWSAFLSGAHVIVLRWKRGGDSPESFPPFPGEVDSRGKALRRSKLKVAH